MNRRLTLTGKNANEVYYISYPKNLMIFLKYDFTIFMERSIDLCRLYMKTGEYHPEEVAEIRSTVAGCHKYVEQNIHGVFEKLVIDCWIEYICRQNEIGVVTLWNNFIPCKNDFEKAVFSRLCEYRHNFAINQWVNLLKIQEYALCKVDFVFGSEARDVQAASARVNYFDLMFNVTANEMGFDLSGIAENKVYNMGRIPNSPIVMRNVSREIVRNVLSDVKYLDDNKFKAKKGNFASDQTAMDAFSAIKAYIPSENDNIVGTMIKSMSEVPKKVYVPAGLKAVIDLEIDALIESGAVLQRCNRCREYFTRDEDYDYDYCDRINREGRSCLDLMNENAKKEKSIGRAADSTLLGMRCDWLYKEMSSRVNVDINQRDFTDWYKYLTLIRDNVLNGTATMEDFESFVEYSLSMSFNPQKNNLQEGSNRQYEASPAQYQPPKYVQSEKYNQPTKTVQNNNIQQPALNVDYTEKRDVKPFIFERVNRNSLEDREFISPQPSRNEYIPVPPPPSSKIIRGAAPVSGLHEVDYDNSAVTIPYGEEKSSKPDTPQAVLKAVLENNAVNDDNEDDVKIYDIDTVKVFEPGSLTKPKRSAEKSRFKPLALRRERQEPAPEKETAVESVNPPKPVKIAEENKHPPSYEQYEQPKQESNIREAQAINIPPIRQDIKKQHAVSAYRNAGVFSSAEQANNVPVPETQKIPPRAEVKSGQERDRGGNLWETSETRKIPMPESKSESNVNREIEHTISNPILNRAIEQTQELDFSENDNFDSILKNIDRKDGFEQIPTDSDGVPVSHKTKRVMDAIFKPSKNSMFFNINRNDEEQ